MLLKWVPTCTVLMHLISLRVLILVIINAVMHVWQSWYVRFCCSTFHDQLVICMQNTIQLCIDLRERASLEYWRRFKHMNRRHNTIQTRQLRWRCSSPSCVSIQPSSSSGVLECTSLVCKTGIGLNSALCVLECTSLVRKTGIETRLVMGMST